MHDLPKLKIVFFGLGSIGQRHLRLLRDNPSRFGVHEFFTLRSGHGNSSLPPGVRELKDWSELKALGADVAFVCNPTALHLTTAKRCLELEIPVFLEKPIAADISGLDEICLLSQRKGLPVYVAYPFRFHPGVLALKKSIQENTRVPGHARLVVSTYLPSWRPGTDHRKSYSANSSLGGGVILDLSHEFDLCQFLFGEVGEIQGAGGRLSDVTVDAEDWGDAVFRAGSFHVNIHMSLFSKKSVRTIDVDLPDRSISLDLLTGELVQYGPGADERLVRSFAVERDDVFLNQLDYFQENRRRLGLMNGVTEAAPLFGRLVEFREKLFK